jgi:hypothetical protein
MCLLVSFVCSENPANTEENLYAEEDMQILDIYDLKLKGIRKRMDNYMGHGCSSHESGLAFGLYALFIRKNFEKIII